MLKRWISLTLLASAIVGCSTDDEDGSTIPTGVVLDVDSGPVEGVVEGSTRVFRGIPYAAPPVGPLRWAPPEPAEAWSAPLDASLYGPICPQPDLFGSGDVAGAEEDCLTLNVWSSEPAPSSLLPVMVFFHGGGFTRGSSRGLAAEPEAGAAYTGEHLVPKGNVILVTANYRLGELGFLTLPELDSESPSGNYGLQDQQAALRWVRDNIAQFGGDPDNVTIFGESAGGISVCAHMRMPESQGLFQRAILESGPCRLLVRPPALASQQGQALMDQLECDDLACMRAKSATEVLELPTPEGTYWGPVADGAVLPADLYDIADVPMITGTNLDEGTLFLNDSTGLAEEDYEAAIAELAPFFLIDPADAPQVAAHYPVADYDSPHAALAAVYGDAVFTCPVGLDADALSPKTDVYRYFITHPIAHAFADSLGVSHGSELLLVFGTRLGILGELADGDRAISDAVIGYWTRFAATGDPNGGDAERWPTYDEGKAHLELAEPFAPGSDLLADDCAFWRGLWQ